MNIMYFSIVFCRFMPTYVLVKPPILPHPVQAEAVGKHLQAELTREIILVPHAFWAYSGTTATSATYVFVNSPQNFWLSSNRPETEVDRMARRQLSALQPWGLQRSFLVILTTKAPRSMVLTKMNPDLK